MLRRALFRQTGLAAAGTAGLAMPAIAQSSPALRWRMTSSYPKSLETIYGTGEVFARIGAAVPGA